MKYIFKYQTLSNIALLLILSGWLSIAFINEQQANSAIATQIEIRDDYQQSLNKARNLYVLSSNTYTKITNYIDYKDSSDTHLLLALKGMDSLIQENVRSNKLEKWQGASLRKKINTTKSLFLAYVDKSRNYSSEKTELQQKKAVESSFVQIRNKLFALPKTKNNRSLQKLGLDLINHMQVILDSLSKNKIKSIDKLDSLLSEMELQLNNINILFKETSPYVIRDKSLQKEKRVVSPAYKTYHEQYNKFIFAANAYLHIYDNVPSLDHLTNTKEEFISHWKNIELLNTLFVKQLNGGQDKKINTGISYLVENKSESRLTMLVGLVAVLIAMVLLRKALTRRLNILKDGARQLTNGAFDKEIILTSHDEFGQLADAFNHMAEQIHLREIALSDINANLEQRVTVRTKELMLSRDAAEAANVAKSDFLSTMSHEIRTPMNGVIGMLELLIRSSLQDDQKRFVITASQSANNLLDIINEILDFSKIEAGQLIVENITFNLTTLLEDCTSLLAERAHKKGIELICDANPKLPTFVIGDPTRLRQVLINLVGNAIKFTESGEVILRCHLNTKTSSLSFNVSDTGIGIPQKALAQLFTAFSQVDGSTTRKYGGTGLGLTISQRLTQLMGGKLAVESIEGKGSNFHFDLALTEANSPLSSDSVDKDPLIYLKNIHILIVDDSQTNLDIISGYLSSWGISHDTANNAKKALALCKATKKKAQHYDLVLMDDHMPNIGGKQLAKTLKKDDILSAIPLILLSSSSMLDSEAKTLGFSAWLDKPVRQLQLQQAMRKALSPEDAITPESDIEHSQSALLNGYVLLVDDHEVNLTIAKATLEKMGITVITAMNGQEAIKQWQQEDVDLILMDLQMPVMDGFQATQKIRQQESKTKKHRTPIIAMTANAMEEDKKRCLEYDMDDHLPKPFKWSQLEATLVKWIAEPTKIILTKKEETPALNLEPIKLSIEKEDKSERLFIEEPSLETELDVLDIQRVNETIDLFGNDFIELAEAMLTSTEESIVVLTKASKENDLNTLNSEGHRLKGGIGNLGSLAMMESCQLIERKSKVGDVQGSNEQVKKLPLQFQQFKEALKDIIKTKLNHTFDIN